MGAGAEAALEDQAQPSSGQAQSYRELEAGRLMEDNSFFVFPPIPLVLGCAGIGSKGVLEMQQHRNGTCILCRPEEVENKI